MRTKNHCSRKHHSRKRKQHRSRMTRRKSRAYGRRKMFGGSWFQIRKNGIQKPVDKRDELPINTIVYKYRYNIVNSNPGDIIEQDLPSKSKLHFQMGNSTGHMKILKNMKYGTKSGKHDLVEVNETPIPTHRFTADGTAAFDTISGRRM